MHGSIDLERLNGIEGIRFGGYRHKQDCHRNQEKSISHRSYIHKKGTGRPTDSPNRCTRNGKCCISRILLVHESLYAHLRSLLERLFHNLDLGQLAV